MLTSYCFICSIKDVTIGLENMSVELATRSFQQEKNTKHTFEGCILADQKIAPSARRPWSVKILLAAAYRKISLWKVGFILISKNSPRDISSSFYMDYFMIKILKKIIYSNFKFMASNNKTKCDPAFLILLHVILSSLSLMK